MSGGGRSGCERRREIGTIGDGGREDRDPRLLVDVMWTLVACWCGGGGQEELDRAASERKR